MTDILEFFDSINIDIAKRKYYNVNKVNAVLEELRARVVELVEENERQRRELDALRTERVQKQSAEIQAKELLSEIQALYRATLTKAHERADEIIQDGETRRDILLKETEEKKAVAAEQLKACFQALQGREEENIQILNSQMNQLLSTLGGEKRTTHTSVAVENGRDEENAPLGMKVLQTVGIKDEEEILYGSGRDQLKDLELQIQRLAKEINALESGI